MNVPFSQYGVYVQDDWRLTERLTLNLGLRYDLVTGVQIDRSRNPNFRALQAATCFALTSGRLAGSVQPAAFMQPAAFAGDFRQPEQRVGQVGFRVTY